MKTILLTGATGFVGSALAAAFLARSDRVIALARNDPDGERTRAAVRAAAEGFEASLPETVLDQHLDVVEVDHDSYVARLASARLAAISDVWHVAADMSMGKSKLPQSFATNVGMTSELYGYVATHVPQCRRFYYMSTAYVVGLDGGQVDESLHFGGNCVNPYQVSKRCAEYSLALLSSASRLPVTIFRPTIVVGHRVTGWTVRNGFGLYMFVEAIKMIAAGTQKSCNLPLTSTSRPDLLSVDRLVEQAVTLTVRPQATKPLEIFNCSGGGGMSMGEVVTEIGRLCGVAIRFSPPETELEKVVVAGMEPRMPFANTDWQFSRSKLDQAMGDRHGDLPLSLEELRRIVSWYLAAP
nr:SDR family oxidoreductase [Luteibacter rhizovicinus]